MEEKPLFLEKKNFQLNLSKRKNIFPEKYIFRYIVVTSFTVGASIDPDVSRPLTLQLRCITYVHSYYVIHVNVTIIHHVNIPEGFYTGKERSYVIPKKNLSLCSYRDTLFNYPIWHYTGSTRWSLQLFTAREIDIIDTWRDTIPQGIKSVCGKCGCTRALWHARLTQLPLSTESLTANRKPAIHKGTRYWPWRRVADHCSRPHIDKERYPRSGQEAGIDPRGV